MNEQWQINKRNFLKSCNTIESWIRSRKLIGWAHGKTQRQECSVEPIFKTCSLFFFFFLFCFFTPVSKWRKRPWNNKNFLLKTYFPWPHVCQNKPNAPPWKNSEKGLNSPKDHFITKIFPLSTKRILSNYSFVFSLLPASFQSWNAELWSDEQAPAILLMAVIYKVSNWFKGMTIWLFLAGYGWLS